LQTVDQKINYNFIQIRIVTANTHTQIERESSDLNIPSNQLSLAKNHAYV